jgi:beta-fructofuranosidase
VLRLDDVNAEIGHAIRDLVNWDYLGPTFQPSEIGRRAFDDMAIWTGSVLNDGRQWWMFYTAISHAGHHLFDQRVGAAVSNDLHHWRRVANEPAVYPDSRWYKTLAIKPAPTKGPDIDRSSETSGPGPGFGQLEVLQNKIIAGRPVLVFTCHPQVNLQAHGANAAYISIVTQMSNHRSVRLLPLLWKRTFT